MLNSIYNILIIDDNPAFGRSLRNLMYGTFYSGIDTVAVARDIPEAVILLRDHDFHYLFVSMKMRENIEWVGKSIAGIAAGHPRIRIVIISYCNEPEFKRKMSRYGAGYCLSEDEIDADKLIEIFESETTLRIN